MLEVLVTSIPFLIALGIGLFVPFGIFVTYWIASNFKPTTRLNLLLWGIATGTMLEVVLAHRNLNLESKTAVQTTTQDLLSGSWSARLITLAVLGVAVSELIRGWLMSRKKLLPNTTYTIFLWMLLYHVGILVLGFTGATEPSFSYKSLYIPLTILSIYYLANNPLDIKSFILNIKWIMLIFMFASLLAAVVAPNYALLRPYDGIFPGIHFRLYGISWHSNTLGPIALLLIMVELYFPSKSRWLRYTIFVKAMIVFLLAQSKTAWIAAALITILVFIPQGFSALRTRKHGFQTAVIVIMVIPLLLVAVMAMAYHMDLLTKVTENQDELTSLTGRTQIWSKTISEFIHNPFFGYGPTIWGPEYRFKAGMLFAGQAHNQFIQTSGESGGIGLFLLVAYLTVMFRYAVKLYTSSRGLLMAIFIFIFVRCLTESPLRAGGVLLDWPVFTHFLLVIFTVYYANLQGQKATNDEIQPATTQAV